MLTILYEWKNSLTLFKKDTLLLLLYSWYKLTVQVYKNLLVHFWWLVLPLLTIELLQYSLDLHSIIVVLSSLLSYIVLILARPSLEKKNFRYVFNKGLSYAIPVIFTTVLYIFSIIICIGFFSLSSIPFRTVGGLFFFNWFKAILTFFKEVVMPLYIWTFLFLLDSKGSFKDCFKVVWNGYKMMLFNLPTVMVLVSFLKASYYIIALISNFLPASFSTLIYDLTYPFVIGLIVTVYIKRVHDQCNLYFGRGSI